MTRDGVMSSVNFPSTKGVTIALVYKVESGRPMGGRSRQVVVL